MSRWTHLDLLAWYDREWPDPRKAPEVLRVPIDAFNAVMIGLEPGFRFVDPRLVYVGGNPTIRLRPFGCWTNLVLDESVDRPTPDTVDGVLARFRPEGP